MDAIRFAKWLSEFTGERYRLPSVEEWEYTARAGEVGNYCYGDTIRTDQANFKGRNVIPVATYAPNAWGMYDVHGNVWEWTILDRREKIVPNSTIHAKGGAWMDAEEKLCFSFHKVKKARERGNHIGFRLVKA